MKSKRIVAMILALAMMLGTTAFAAEYTVKSGDTLAKIAKSELGDSSRWKEIYEANKGTLKDPNKIVVGQKLTIPDGKTGTKPTTTVGEMAPGTYTGTAMGFGGPITVEVTFTKNAITDVKVTGELETPDVGGAALNRLGYLARTQGLEMDAVTGATYTSRGVKDALSVALAKATGKTVGLPADGKYTVNAIGHEGIIVVSTMFKDGKMMSVAINSQSETEGIGTYAIDRMPSRFVPAQSFNVDAVGGATVSSAAIKQGVAEAIIAAGGDPADFATAPAKAEIVPTEVTENVDVVIAGAGTAGLLAAARLLEAGVKNVVLFEKQDIPGGSMAMAFSGFNGVDSEIYQNWSLGRNVNMLMSTWDYVGPALYARAVANGSFHGDDPSLPWLQQMYSNAGSLYDWMTSIGVGFYTLGVEPAYTSPYFSPGCYSGGCGYAMEFFVDRITAQGGRIIYNTEVTDLIQAADGTVTGVVAKGEDGKTWTVNAKQTMLATGGFTKDKELLEQYHSQWANESFICPESLTGDGLRMGLKAGGVVDYADAYMPGFLATYNSHFELAFLHYMKAGIMVNVHGDEFANILVDNHATMAKAKADPANGNTFYYVFDEAGAATIKDFDSYKFTYKGIFEKGEAVHYDSVEAAAKALNLPNLAATIEANNGYAMAGTPNAFGMAGTPYLNTTDGIWLVRVEPVVYLTTAGLRVDIDGHLLTENNEIIPNLWAAGDVIGSYEQRETRYGNGFDAAVSFGAKVGDNIAEVLTQAKTYEASARGFDPLKKVTVSTTIQNGEITAIEIIDSAETMGPKAAVEEQFIPRILKEQSLAVDGVTGATSTSTAVRQAVLDCCLQAGLSRSDVMKRVEKTPGADETYDVDVVVVGMGSSGTAAALSAAENGATVLSIDKSGKWGGTGAITSGPTGVNVPSQVEKEIEGWKDAWTGQTITKKAGDNLVDRDALYKEWTTYTTVDGVQHAKTDIIELELDLSGAVLDWLTGYGFQFGNAGGFVGGKWAIFCSYVGGKTLTESFFAKAYDNFEEMGGKYMLETEATGLIVEDGKVVGVKAEKKDGTQVTINAKNVILATGGFGGSSEMMEKYLGESWKLYGMAQNDGKMIESAIVDAGANPYNIDMPPMSHFVAPYSIMTAFDPADNDIPYGLVATGESLAVDQTGERKIAETGLAMEAYTMGAKFFTIWSAEQIEILKTQGLSAAASGRYLSQGGVKADTPLTNIDAVIEEAVRIGTAYKAASLDELAAVTGMDADTLKASVAGYQAAAEGTDPLGKAAGKFERMGAPASDSEYYVAFVGAPYIYSTVGGLEVNADMQVMNTEGQVISGLYAVGTDSMGVLFTNTKGYANYGGIAQGYCFTSGKIAGANAAGK